MFRAVASYLKNTSLSPAARADTVLSADARVLAHLLDSAWIAGGRGQLEGVPRIDPSPLAMRTNVGSVAIKTPAVSTWPHLIYAYMIEQTRIVDIMRRVVWEANHGERLGARFNAVTHAWLVTTEELFFRDAAPSPLTIASRIRPDPAAARRNAYYRMFGMDLNHGPDGGGVYPYEKPAAANREFVPTFEEFLRTVWRAIQNVTNVIGPRDTDPDAIANLALRLQNMMNARRGGSPTSPTLARDEFIHVATMDWFHLTVDEDTSVVRDLRATGSSAEDRLRMIGERVGIPAHARSHDYFQIAPCISTLLSEIELGSYSTPGGAQSLFGGPAPGDTTNPIRDNILKVINHWSHATGRDLKGQRVTVDRTAPITAVAVASRNGDGAAVGAGSASK